MPLAAHHPVQGACLAASQLDLGGGRPLGTSKEGFELTKGPVIPRPGIGRRGPLSDMSSFGAIPGRLEEGDAVKDGAIQRR